MGQKVAAQSKIDPGELKVLWEAGTPMNVIAERFGVTPSSVSKRGRALGLRPIGFVQRDLRREGKGTVSRKICPDCHGAGAKVDEGSMVFDTCGTCDGKGTV